MDKYQFLHTGSYVKIILHNIPEKPGVFAKMTNILADRQINILTIRHLVLSADTGEIAFTVSKDQADEAFQLMEHHKKEIGASDVTIKKDLALVFILGEGIKNLSAFVSDVMRAFSEYNVDFDSLTTTQEGMTCILPEHQFNQAMHAFNKMFVDEPIISPI
ncbi:MAG: ACT domain-containing protein [Candidatus Zhuqueibacterota bacterium]